MMRSTTIDYNALPGQPDGEMIDRHQIRMARIGLGWTAADLAERSGLSLATIRRAETTRVPTGNLYLIQRTFEAVGVVFLEAGQTSRGGGPGVRLPRREGQP